MTEKDLTAENNQLDPQPENSEETSISPEPADEQPVAEEKETKHLPSEGSPESEGSESNETEPAEMTEAETLAHETPAETAIASAGAEETKEETTVEEATSGEKPAEKQEDTTEDDADEKEPEAEKGKKATKHHDDELVRQLNDDTSNQGSDEEDEEDESDDAEEEHEVTLESFEEHTRVQLVDLLEATVTEQNIQKIKSHVAMIKVAFLKLTRNEEQERYQKYIDEGGDKENYVPQQDELTEKFNRIFDIYRKNKIKFNEEQEVLKLRNLDAKKQILEDLKELISSEDSLKKTYDQFKDLQNKWKEIGLVPANEINNLWQSYHFLVEKFFDKVKISRELRDLDLKKNLDLKIELCEKAEELLLETSIVKSFKQLQKYHEEWKEIGPVPAEKRDEIWERFKSATDKINERRREYYSNISEQQEKNLLAKKALCEKAEELISEEASSIKGWQQKTDGINELFNLWKSIGPAPKKENDEIWDRFKICLNTFFTNKKDYFNQLKQEQINNYNLKLDIVQQAEAIRDSKEWKKTTQDLISLQKEWKNIGPVPRKYSDKIWKRFRAACDEFFKSKSEYFANIGEIESQNLQKKLDLIKKVRDQKFGGDKNQNLDIIKELQREWMEIGHVPIKEKDKVQQAFREAINKHLDNLNISVVEVKEMDYQTHLDSIKDGPNSSRILRKEMGFLSGKISKLREEIHLWENNIGFLAHSKRADILRKEFENKIEKAKEELALSEAKLRMLQESED